MIHDDVLQIAKFRLRDAWHAPSLHFDTPFFFLTPPPFFLGRLAHQYSLTVHFYRHVYMMPSFSQDQIPSRSNTSSNEPRDTSAPGYIVEEGVTFELNVVGHDLHVSHFDRAIVGNGEPQPVAYQLIYSYQAQHDTLHEHIIFFLGGKPQIHFLCEDNRFDGSPIVDYGLVQGLNAVRLEVSHQDATQDESREPFGTGRSYHGPDFFVHVNIQVQPRPSSPDSDIGTSDE